MRESKNHPLKPFHSPVDAMNRVPTKTNSAWQTKLGPFAEFGVRSESDGF